MLKPSTSTHERGTGHSDEFEQQNLRRLALFRIQIAHDPVRASARPHDQIAASARSCLTHCLLNTLELVRIAKHGVVYRLRQGGRFKEPASLVHKRGRLNHQLIEHLIHHDYEIYKIS